MGKYTVKLSKRAERDLNDIYKSGDKQGIKKIAQIFEELIHSPSEGIGKPELMKYKQEEMWSRRINRKDRVVYIISEDEVFVLSATGHYGDK